MDSLAQVIAHLQPSFEFFTKLAATIPLWLLLIIADKHLLGLPLFEGSLWRSPRIPPLLNIGGDYGREHGSRTKSGRTSPGSGGRYAQGEAAPFGPSPLERAFAEFSTPHSYPSQAPPFLSDASPVWASGTTALSLYEPLEVHDPFESSSRWLEPCYVGTAVLLVLALAFLWTIVKNRWFPTGKNQASQARKNSDVEALVPDPVAVQQLTENMGFPICWESYLGTFGLAYPILATIQGRINEPTPPPPTLSFSAITSVQTPLSAPASQQSSFQHHHEENRELKKVIELMEINAEKTQIRVANLLQQNRGLRWAGEQKTRNLAAIEARAAELRFRSADHATNEPAQAKNDPEDVPQEDHKPGEDLNSCAQREESEDDGKNGKEEEQKKPIVEKDDCESDDSGEIPDLSLFFRSSERRKRRRIRKSKAVQAGTALWPEDPVGGETNNESPSSPLSHDLPRKDMQGTTVNEGQSTPPAAALTFPATLIRTPVESAQGGRDKSGEEEETVNTAKKDMTASKIESHDDNGKKLVNEDGNETVGVKEDEKGKGREYGNDGRGAKADASAPNKKQEDGNDDGNGNGREAAEEGGKEGQSKGDRGEDLESESGEIFEHDGLDGDPAVGERKRKKHNMRQNAKRRVARAAAAGEASKEVGKYPNAFREDTGECGEKEGKAKEVRGALEAFREDEKAREKKEGKGFEVGKDEEGNEKNDANNAVELLACDLPDTEPSEAPEARKKSRRRRGRKHEIKNHAEDSKHGTMTKKKKTEKNTTGQEKKKILANDMDPQAGRVQINGKTFPYAPIQEGKDHPTSLNRPPHNWSQGGGDYQRLKNLLDESTLGRAQTNDGAISDTPSNDREPPICVTQHVQFQGRAPFETLIRNNFSGRVPWVASSLPYTRRSHAYPDPAPSETQNRNVFPDGLPREAPALSYNRRIYTYPDQGTTGHAQRPIFVGPGVEPRNLVAPSTPNPWNSICSWQPAGSFSRQGPLNEPIIRTWNNSAVASLVPRGRLPYSEPPLEHRTDSFAENTCLAPFRAPFFIGSHSSSRFATTTSDGLVVLFQGPTPHLDDRNAGEIDGIGTGPAPTPADRSDERYQYFPERGARSQSSPPRSRCCSRSSVRNRRPQSLPPHHSNMRCIE